MDKKYIDKFINPKYFDYPKKFFESFITSLKMHYLRQQVELLSPCLVVCNKSCEYDEFLLRRTISTDYVVLKDNIVRQIYAGTLSKSDKKDILKQFKVFKDALISVVIFPENQISIFGRSESLPNSITEFMYESGMNLKFVSFANAYFAKPIWSERFRNVQTYFSSKFNLSNSLLATMTEDERNSKINKSMPSSASVYSHKNHLQINSNNLAEGLERIVFACPNCHKFFSLKCEYHHLKCSNCMTPFECTSQGDIYTNGKTINFDDIEIFLDNILQSKKFAKNFIIGYENISLAVVISDSPVHILRGLRMDIFKNSLKFEGVNFEKIIDFKDVVSFEYLPKNTLKLSLKNGEVFQIQASSNENLYIIYALLKINK